MQNQQKSNQPDVLQLRKLHIILILLVVISIIVIIFVVIFLTQEDTPVNSSPDDASDSLVDNINSKNGEGVVDVTIFKFHQDENAPLGLKNAVNNGVFDQIISHNSRNINESEVENLSLAGYLSISDYINYTEDYYVISITEYVIFEITFIYESNDVPSIEQILCFEIDGLWYLDWHPNF